MSAFFTKFGVVLAVVYCAAVLGWYCWRRVDVGRFSYHESNGSVTVLDSRTGTFYAILERGVWREVKPQTGQCWDRAYVKVN